MNKVRKAYGRMTSPKERFAFVLGVTMAIGIVLLVAAGVVSAMGFAGLFATFGLLGVVGLVCWVVCTLADSDL